MDDQAAEPSEDVRDAMRLLDEQKAMLDKLRAAMIEGEGSGDPAPFDLEAFLSGKRAEATERP